MNEEPTKPSEVFRDRLRQTREARNLSQSELARLMTDAGRPLSKIAVLRCESGDRGISLDEALTFAIVLEIAPAHLLTPAEGAHLWVTNRMGLDGGELRNWLIFGDPFLITADGRRVRSRNRLWMTIESQAQAIVDAKRAGDEHLAKDAMNALLAAVCQTPKR